NSRRLLYLFLLSFTYNPHISSLHSFPTRRSSDLLPVELSQGVPGDPDLPRRSPLQDLALHDRGQRAQRRPPRGSPSSRPGEAPRSEEHTSELQSRRDLVCRLLLEKKKKKKDIIRQ